MAGCGTSVFPPMLAIGVGQCLNLRAMSRELLVNINRILKDAYLAPCAKITAQSVVNTEE